MHFAKSIRFTIGDEQCHFRSITPDDVDEKYAEALRRQQKYIAARNDNITVEFQKNYVREIMTSQQNAICGLFVNGQLKGTSGIQSLKRNGSQPATMGFFVLDPNERGRGYGKAMIWAATTLATVECHINRMEAGLLLDNTPSLKAFLSFGFELMSESNGTGRVGMDAKNMKMPKHVENVQIVDA
jgi:RimJ/RimL family protein N-acetyltransferase